MNTSMVGYFGHYRTTEVEISVIDLGCGAGKITCVECGGSGDWTPYHPEPGTGPYPCVTCKAQGYTLISIA